ncbi:hypothetical protein [Roseomonas chloroacetimidivorans]|uniref:hypothetical protein n=1 Tax=Roseomonas chloroacetimidivorans TaxID=1766656 RepID=UPI003C7308D5
MSARTLGKCAECAYWRTPESTLLAGTPGAAAADALGQCRRRVQTDDAGVKPRPPITPGFFGCSEHLVLPLPDRLPQSCSQCRFWRSREGGAEGFCCAWAPRHSIGHPNEAPVASRFAFPITPAGFFCGDGVNVAYVDPEEEEIIGLSMADAPADPLDPAAQQDWDWPPVADEERER